MFSEVHAYAVMYIMNNCENPSSKPRTVHLRFAMEGKKNRSRFVILRTEDARGSTIFKRRYPQRRR